MTEPTLEQFQGLELRIQRLKEQYAARWRRQEGEINGLYDRLQESHKEAAKVWNLVPAWVQKQEIKKATSWICTDGPAPDSVVIHAECDFRGMLSVVSLALNLESLDRLERARRIRSAIHDLQAGIIADQFRIHRITENDVQRNGRAVS